MRLAARGMPRRSAPQSQAAACQHNHEYKRTKLSDQANRKLLGETTAALDAAASVSHSGVSIAMCVTMLQVQVYKYVQVCIRSQCGIAVVIPKPQHCPHRVAASSTFMSSPLVLGGQQHRLILLRCLVPAQVKLHPSQLNVPAAPRHVTGAALSQQASADSRVHASNLAPHIKCCTAGSSAHLKDSGCWL